MTITECYESRTLVTCSWRENKLKLPKTNNSNRPGYLCTVVRGGVDFTYPWYFILTVRWIDILKTFPAILLHNFLSCYKNDEFLKYEHKNFRPHLMMWIRIKRKLTIQQKKSNNNIVLSLRQAVAGIIIKLFLKQYSITKNVQKMLLQQNMMRGIHRKIDFCKWLQTKRTHTSMCIMHNTYAFFGFYFCNLLY